MNRKEKLITGQFYHVYNRGVEKRVIYSSFKDYQRFKTLIFHYLITNKKFTDENPEITALTKVALDRSLAEGFKKKVEVLAYCLMPNHFHIMIKQLTDRGVSEYMHRVITSYTKYFNKKYDRVGPLLQGPFRYKRIESEGQLIYVSKYIHRNPIESSKNHLSWNHVLTYRWSSLPSYQLNSEELLFKEPVLNSFTSIKSYLSFLKESFEDNQVNELRELYKNSDEVLGSESNPD